MKSSSIIFLAVPASLSNEIRQFSHRHIEEEDTDDVFMEKAFEADFRIDPSILLPVELPPGEKSLNPAELSWEMIFSGMLRIISVCRKNPSSENQKGTPVKKPIMITPGTIVSVSEIAGIPPEWTDYYRSFVLTVKPEIYHEFTGATIVKAGNGEFDLALEISDVLEGLFPGSPGVLLNKALLLENRAAALEKNGHEAEKENGEAYLAYQEALSLEPVLPDTFFNAGFFFIRRRDFVRAKECFSRYISAGEESELVQEIPRDKMKQAKKIIKEINEQGLDDNSFREAYEYINRGKDEKGLLKIREFIEKNPKVWNGWFILGWALRKLGRYKDSLEALKKAAELGGTSSDVRNETAICLMELGDLKGAKKELEQALREDSENTKIISNLGVLAQKSGKNDEAAAFFRTVLEMDPDDTIARHYLKTLYSSF